MEEEKSPYSFDGQRADEDVVHLWRMHPWVMAKTGFWVVLILFISFLPLLLPGGFTGTKLIIIGSIISAVLILNALYGWWNTVYVLSNQRVIGVDQSKLLMREVHEVPLENIQNITFVQKGLGATMFGYGTVKIQTAGGKTAVRLRNVEHPLKVQQEITESGHKLSRSSK